MSVVVTVAAAGTVVLASPLFTAIAVGAAAAMGLRAVGAAARESAEDRLDAAFADEAARQTAEMERVEVTVATEAALAEVVAERCVLRFADDAVEITITRDIRGQVSVRAHSHSLPRAEVAARAEKLLGLIQQQVAYRSVVTRLRAHGMDVASEARAPDGTVRVTLRRGR